MNYVKSQISKNMKANTPIKIPHILSNLCKSKIINSKENYTCTCKDCNGTFDIDDTIKTKYGDKICHDCYREHYTIYDIYGNIIYASDVSTLQFGINTLDICEDCAL